MKKIYLAFFLACAVGGAANAQISEGGIPWSMNIQSPAFSAQQVARIDLPAPDYDKYRAEDLQDAINNVAKPYRVEAVVHTDISLQNAGTWYYAEDGSIVWRAEIAIPGALALDFYYDKFTLPQGVKYYLSNENGRQLLGAYTSANHNEFNSFTNEHVQGNVAILEMNIPAGVDLSKIDFHIHEIGAIYRGAENLTARFGGETRRLAEKPTSSPCHVNANCPEGDGAAWAKAKNATVRIQIGTSGFCSGSMINSAGNTAGGDCKQYLLTASHCDGTNSYNDETFANWKFDFNYQKVTCDGPSVETARTRTGAYFRARSHNPSFPSPANSLVADFLLLELKTPPQAAADAYLVGWNRQYSFNDELEDYQFVGFHHPAGDHKKLSRSDNADLNGTFNQSVVSGTHWETNFFAGGTEGGSSGSGLFDKDGLLIGDLSGGPSSTGDCAPMEYSALYSKFSYAWDNEFDQTAFPSHAGSASRLKDWLDPSGTNRMTLPSAKYDCSDITSAQEIDVQLSNAFVVYPNPSKDGRFTLKFNSSDILSGLTVSVVNVLGAVVRTFDLGTTNNATVMLDLSALSNGIYMVNLNTAEGHAASKKIVIAK
jgi:lysyl endopeptidase